MKTKIVVIVNNENNIEDSIPAFDKNLYSTLIQKKINARSVLLADLLDPRKIPIELDDWSDYNKVVIACDSITFLSLSNLKDTIKNAELWVIRWPKPVADSNDPAIKLFDNVPALVREATYFSKK
jgi:hypothetical protein